MNTNKYAILMAGGVGSRFWPVSTQDFPKQFHDMLGTGQTLIQKTFHRLATVIPKDNIFILTNAQYNDLVLEQLPEVTQRQVILEPAMRNTAPCVLYAALKIQKENPEALILVAPSDHWIEDEMSFAKDLETSFDFCSKKDALMTLGIAPTFPNTGYGYIEFDTISENHAVKKVRQFREKPDYQTAQEFLKAQCFLWNAGIFIWSAQSIIRAFRTHQPQLYELLASGIDTYNTPQERHFIEANYEKADNISIDYAIMEKANNVYVITATFDWNDLGSWGSLYDKLEKDPARNALTNARLLPSEGVSGNMIRTASNKIVVIEQLNDYIVVDNNDVLLIVPQSKEQDIKNILQRVRTTFGEQYR